MTELLTKLGFALIIAITLISQAMAQSRPPIVPEGAGDLKIPTIKSDVAPEIYVGGVFIPNITKFLLFGAGGIAVVFIMVAAVQMLTAYGKDEQLDTAKKTITYAIVGLLICILAYAIVSIISSINLN